MIPRWYRTVMRLEKKMMVGRIQNVKVFRMGDIPRKVSKKNPNSSPE
jgi:hypothetical protein